MKAATIGFHKKNMGHGRLTPAWARKHDCACPQSGAERRIDPFGTQSAWTLANRRRGWAAEIRRAAGASPRARPPRPGLAARADRPRAAKPSWVDPFLTHGQSRAWLSS